MANLSYLTLLAVLLTFDLCYSTAPTDAVQALTDLREHLDRRVESFRADVHRSFQQHHQRIRRSIDIDLAGTFEGQSPLLVDNVTVVEQFFVGLEVYLVVGRKKAGDGSYHSTATIHRFNLSNYTKTGEFPTYGVSDIEAFNIGGHVYIAVANQIRDPGTYDGMSDIYRFDTTTENVVPVQQILTHGASDLMFFDFEGDTYLLLANLREDAYAKYQSELGLYFFSGAHFDLIASVQTYGATAVAYMEIEWEPYIIVAQYVDNDGRYDVGSVVYKFDVESDKLHRVQTLATSAPKDIETFSLNGNYYLAVANHGQVSPAGVFDNRTDSVIYWWTGVQFIEYQRIPTHSATQWEEVELLNGEILLVLSSLQNVTVYEFSVNAEWVPAEAQFTDLPSVEGVAFVESIEAANGLFVVVTDSHLQSSDYRSGTTNVFKVVTSQQPPYVAPVSATTTCLRSVEDRLDSATSSVDDLNDELEGALKLSGDQDVVSKLVFQGVIVAEQTLEVVDLTLNQDYSFNIEPPVIADSVSIDGDLARLLPRKAEVVTISGVESITSPLVFTKTLLSDSTSVVTATTTTGEINGINIPNLNDTLLKLNGDQTVDASATFAENVSLSNADLHVNGKIDGVDVPDDVMTIGGVQTADGSLTFTNATAFNANVAVDGRINGLNLTEDVVTTHLDHAVAGTKTVRRDLELSANATVADGQTVDSVDLTTLESGAVSRSNGGTLSGVLTFSGEVQIDGELRTDLVDGVNVTELDSAAVLKHTVQSIYGNKSIVGNLTAASDIDVYAEINGVPPSEFVLLRTPGGDIMTQVRFAKNVSVVGDITINGKLNDLKIPEDVVTINNKQDIYGTNQFKEDITVSGNIDIKEMITLASADISELPVTTVNISDTSLQTVSGHKTFTQDANALGNITVDQLINNVNLTKLQRQILSLTQPQVLDLPVEVRGRLVISGDLQLVNDTIDGHQLSQDLVRLDDTSSITGDKIFKDFVEISGDLLLGPGVNISGVDLPELNRTVIRLDAEQTISGDVLIKDDVVMKGDLDIDGTVNGLDISEDVVTLSGPQTITGDKEFDFITVSANVVTDTLNVSGEVNQVNLDDLYSDALMTNGPGDTVTSSVTFDQLQVNNGLQVDGTVDGVNVTDFANNAVSLSGDETISGTLEFTSNLSFSENLTVENVSGIHFDSFIESVVLRDASDVITGEKTFSSNVTVMGDITVDDFINGVDLESINQTYLSRTLQQSLSGLRTFTNNITVDSLDLSAGARVDGIRPSKDVVLINIGGDEVNGTLWFVSLEIDGDVDIGKTLNNIDLIELNRSVVWLEGPGQDITGLWTLEGGMHVIGDIAMLEDMEVNGVDISELADGLVNNDYQYNNTILTPTVFKAPVTIVGDVEGDGLINGVNLAFIYSDAVLSGPDQTISGDKEFNNNLTTQQLVVETNMVSEVIAGNVNLTYLLNSTVLNSTDQEIAGAVTFADDVIFQDHLIIDGLVDGIDLSAQAVLKHSNQQLTGSNAFTNGFSVHGNLTVTGLIDAVDVAQLASVVFLLDTNQTVQGKWIFNSDLTVYGSITGPGTVNGIDIDPELVTRTGNHDVLGSITFDDDVIVQGSLLVGLVNGVNLTEFEKEIVHLVGEFDITGDKVFDNELTLVTNASVLGLVDGIDVGQLFPDHQATAQMLYWQTAELNYTLRSMCAPIKSLQIAVNAQAIQLSHWEEGYQLNNTLATHSYASLHVEEALILAFTESNEAATEECIGTTMYMCTDDDRRACFEIYDDALSAASSVELFAFDDDVFIALTLSKQSSACTTATGADDQVQILKMSNASYEEYVPAQHGADTAMFVISDTLFLAVANQYNTLTGDDNVPSAIYEYNPTYDNFTQLQEVATTRSMAVTHLQHDGNNWLAFTCRPRNTYSLILLWNDTAHQFVLEASVLTYYASDALGLIIEDTPLMLFANEKQSSRYGTFDLNQPISVYEHSAQLGWTLKQDISAVGITQLNSFLIDNIYYLTAVSSVGSIDIYKWSGISEFEFYESLPFDGVVFAHPFVLWGDLHMAVARPVFGTIVSQDMWALLRAVIRGQNELTPLEVHERH